MSLLRVYWNFSWCPCHCNGAYGHDVTTTFSTVIGRWSFSKVTTYGVNLSDIHQVGFQK